MTAPVWIASPPEVHSALLSSGPGPGPLLSAAGAWLSLSVEYTAMASELTATLGAVQAGPWQGPSAEQYVAAHVPYLAWLAQAGADSAGVAAQHEVAASTYATALATMPTLAELAANHVTHGVLVATNFFGINTIPIALNEADYVRMWIQAATTMSTYHAVSGAALASAPRTAPAPPVVKANGVAAAANAPAPGSDFFTQLFNQLVQLVQNPAEVIRAILTDPAALATWFPLLFFIAYEAFFIPVGFTTWGLVLSAPLVLPIAIGVGVNLLLSMGEQSPPGDIPAVPATGSALAGAEQPKALVAGFASGIATPGAPAVAAPAAPVTAAPAAPVSGVMGFGYLVGTTDPGTGLGPTLTDRTKALAPATRVPAAAATVRTAAREQGRARRRRQAKMRGFADAFMDMNADAGPVDGGDVTSVTGSDRGAGTLGFSGTGGNAGVNSAAGLARLAGDGFGGGPRAPMLPDTWGDDASEFAGSSPKSESE